MAPSRTELRTSLELACQAQKVSTIPRGRQQILAMPRAWVLANLEQVAVEAIDLSEEWEYRRMLELAELLDSG